MKEYGVEKKKLLLYANYYYPEVASIAQIYTDLCEGLADTFDITVICSIPCYTGAIEEKYTTQNYYFEEYNGVKVLRVRVPSFDKGNKMSRVKHILAYFIRSMLATFKVERPDVIFTVSQPPVLGGLLGVAGKWITALRGKRTKLIYNIQDYNPEQIIAVGYSKNRFVLRAMMFFDKFSCRRADKIIVVGRDMVDTMISRFTSKSGKLSSRMSETIFINNWIDEKEVYPLPAGDEGVAAFKKCYGLEDKFVVMYSGNIGLYYDLENLIKVIGRFRDDDRIVFAFVGEGTLRSALETYKAENGLENVVFIPYQEKAKLIYSLNAADVHLCVNARGIKGVSCPSKFYGIAAVGKPVLAVLEKGSEVRCIIEETECGLCCEPGDYETVEKNIQWFIDNAGTDEILLMGNRGKDYLVRNLTKDISVEKYKQAILDCIEETERSVVAASSR